MPFQSEKQKRFLYSQKPAVAKKFEAHRTMPDGPVKGERVVRKMKKYRMTDGGKMRY